jgi:hypothetical protein
MNKRKINSIECKLCKNSYALVGFQSHLSRRHIITPDEYVLKFGEYRPKKLSLSEYEGGSFICKIDNVCFKTNKMLAGYIKRKYKIKWEDYIIKYIFNNNLPLCKCGCLKTVKILKYPPYRVDFVSGHNNNPMLGKKHSHESRFQMSNKAKDRIREYRKNNGDNPLPMHHKDVIKKRGILYSNKMMELKCNFYNVKFVNDYDERRKDIYKFKCLKCESLYTQYHGSYFTCTKCNPRIRSKYEEELVLFLKEHLGENEIVRNCRKLFEGKCEIDIFLPSYKVGIEFNGLYWHSERSGNKLKHYHLEKNQMASAVGVRLIQIFEDDWLEKKDIIKSKILHILNTKRQLKRIYARKCEICEITDFKVKKDFLQENHIQGNDSYSIYIGLFHDSKLVSIMTFGGLSVAKGHRTERLGEYELVRFCGNKSNIVIGAFSKLLSYFIKTYRPEKILTYADRCYSSELSNVYLTNGFKFIGTTPPNYWYTNDYVHRIYRFNFTKQKLIELGHDKSKTERQIMQELGYDRIWDCGHLKYEMTFN